MPICALRVFSASLAAFALFVSLIPVQTSANEPLRLAQSRPDLKLAEEMVKTKPHVSFNKFAKKGDSVVLGQKVICFNKNDKPVKCPDKITVRTH